VSSRQPQLSAVLLLEAAVCALLVLRRRWALIVAPLSMLLLMGMSDVGSCCG
jgi:hypothetical protein